MLVLVVLCGVLTAQAQTDEDLRRPYKFGFTIENMQHRREEKDERGIIMGEFGFITADGWYLTTIYATDEEGRFKILGRKRERVGPPLDPFSQINQVTTARPLFQSSPPTRPPITISSPRPFQSVTPTTFRPTTFRPATASTAFQQAAVTQSSTAAAVTQGGAFQGIRGCGSCIIPTTTPRPVDASFVSTTAGFRPSSSSGGSSSSSGGAFGSQSGGQRGSGGSSGGTFNSAGGSSSGFNSGGSSSGAFRPISGSSRPAAGGFTASTMSTASGFSATTSSGGFRPSIVSTTAGFVPTASTTRRPAGFSQQQQAAGFTGQSGGGGYNNRPTSPGYPPSGVPQGGRRPTSIADSLTGGSALDYRFNYTAGYHGHHETGYRDGTKMGGYFVNNRDGVGHRVVYDANEFGYQPRVSQVQLSPNDTPRQDTERDSGRPTYNEFLWFKR